MDVVRSASVVAVAVVLVLVAALGRAGEQLGGARVGRSHRRMLVGREGLELGRDHAPQRLGDRLHLRACGARPRRSGAGRMRQGALEGRGALQATSDAAPCPGGRRVGVARRGRGRVVVCSSPSTCRSQRKSVAIALSWIEMSSFISSALAAYARAAAAAPPRPGPAARAPRERSEVVSTARTARPP